MNKKTFYAFARGAVLLLATVMTTTTAWADAVTKSVKYIDYDADGNKVEKKNDATVIDANHMPSNLSGGWYVVEGKVNYTSGITLMADTYIILSDGAELNVGTEETPISGTKAIYSDSGYSLTSLTIYAQGGNTGKLKAVSSSNNGIDVDKNLTIAGGDVTGISTAANNSDGIYSSSDLTISGSAHVKGVGSYRGIYGSEDIIINGNGVATTVVEGTGNDWGIVAYKNLSATAATQNAEANIGVCSLYGDITLDGCDVTAELTVGDQMYGAIEACDNLIIKNNVRTVVKASTAYECPYGITGYNGKTSIDLGGVYDIQVPAGKPLISELNTCSRTFIPGTPSTIMLLFGVTASDVEGGKFYDFKGVQYDAPMQQWVADMEEVTGDIEANKPYIFVPAEGKTEVAFTVSSPVDIYAISCSPTVIDDWTFTGTYSPLTYGTDVTAPYVYGFAGADQPVGKDAVVAGQFVRAGEGATIPAFRAYLQRDDELVAPQAASRSAAAVPDVIVVRLHNADGSVTAISGELKVDGNGAAADYFTLDGRRLGSKPAGKGLYIRNGKKFIVK